MPSPLTVLMTRPFRRDPNELRRVRVAVPTPEDSTDAIFLALRRIRGPLIVLVTIFTIAVLGLSLIPGINDRGQPYHLSIFEAFYVITYTAATIGFSEYPYTFTTQQRLWMTVCIYMSVTGWAYTLGSIFSLFQDVSFRRAVSQQRFRNKVRHIHEPFYLVVGYGEAGRALCTALDRAGQRLVVIDEDPNRIDVLTTDQLAADVPSITADPRNPSVLGLAGLGHPHLTGVMAMTDKDEMNLAVVMAAHLLRDDVTVIARCTERANIARMNDFRPDAVINPFDRYGSYLLLGLHHPVTYRLISWLLREPGSDLPAPLKAALSQGLWVVCADGHFGHEVVRDLEGAGLDVRLTDPKDGPPEVSDAVGLVAGAESDTTNLSVAAAARLANHDIYLSVRQKSIHTEPLMRSFCPDSVFVATDIVAFEALARVEAPKYWSFIEHAMTQDDEWSKRVLDCLIERVGERTPTAAAVTLDEHAAPAVARWLDHGGTLTLGQLLSDPDDRDQPLQVFATELVRGDQTTYIPDADTELQVGDTIALLVRTAGIGLLRGNLTNDAGVEYLATGHDVPATWIGRAIAHRRSAS